MARAVVQRLADGPEIAYLFWPTVMHTSDRDPPAGFARPLTAPEAIGIVEQLLARPHIRTTGEQERFLGRYREVADDALPAGTWGPLRTSSR